MTFALNRTVRFGLQFASQQPNQTKPNQTARVMNIT